MPFKQGKIRMSLDIYLNTRNQMQNLMDISARNVFFVLVQMLTNETRLENPQINQK